MRTPDGKSPCVLTIMPMRCVAGHFVVRMHIVDVLMCITFVHVLDAYHVEVNVFAETEVMTDRALTTNMVHVHKRHPQLVAAD